MSARVWLRLGAKGVRRGAAAGFEDLHVYQRARELVNAIYRLTRTGAFARDFGLVDQIRRAAVSVMSNIAEGFERGSTKELVQYLFIAKGSCGEVRAQLMPFFINKSFRRTPPQFSRFR